MKPTKASTYKNMVDVLDDMAVIKLRHYTLVDALTPDEKTLLNHKIQVAL